MKYDALSFVPDRPFRAEAGTTEFESDQYCLDLDRAITLHLKTAYLDGLLGDTPREKRQIRKWYFYTVHLNCLYLLLDCFVLRDLKIVYFNIEEITTQNADVVSGSGVGISPRSHHSLVPPLPEQQFVVPRNVLELTNHSFRTATSEFERIYVLSEATVGIVRIPPGYDRRVWDQVTWGLIPNWAKDRKIGYKLINARSEGLADKPSFRDAFKYQRCLIPADVFYEWTAAADGRK